MAVTIRVTNIARRLVVLAHWLACGVSSIVTQCRTQSRTLGMLCAEQYNYMYVGMGCPDPRWAKATYKVVIAIISMISSHLLPTNIYEAL
jgi:hypothetical protein